MKKSSYSSRYIIVAVFCSLQKKRNESASDFTVRSHSNCRLDQDHSKSEREAGVGQDDACSDSESKYHCFLLRWRQQTVADRSSSMTTPGLYRCRLRRLSDAVGGKRFERTTFEMSMRELRPSSGSGRFRGLGFDQQDIQGHCQTNCVGPIEPTIKGSQAASCRPSATAAARSCLKMSRRLRWRWWLKWLWIDA